MEITRSKNTCRCPRHRAVNHRLACLGTWQGLFQNVVREPKSTGDSTTPKEERRQKLVCAGLRLGVFSYFLPELWPLGETTTKGFQKPVVAFTTLGAG